MYSYDDRLRAVKLYIKLGKRAATTIRLLGYPSQKYLRQWYLIYQETGDLPRGYNRPPKYTGAQKQKAIEHYVNHGECFAYTQAVEYYESVGLSLEETVAEGNLQLLKLKDTIATAYEMEGNTVKCESLRAELRPFEEHITWRFVGNVFDDAENA